MQVAKHLPEIAFDVGDFGDLGFKIDVNKSPLVWAHRDERELTGFWHALKERLSR